MGRESSIHVLIADFQPLIRLAIRKELELRGFVVCAEAGGARQALVGAMRHEPDVCVISLDLPGGGLDVARDIATRLLDTKILMLVEGDAKLDLVELIEAGAVGYVEKAIDPGRLPQVVAAAANGEQVIPRRDVHKLLERAHLAR